MAQIKIKTSYILFLPQKSGQVKCRKLPERLYKQSAAKNAFLSETIYQHYVEFQEIHWKPQYHQLKLKGA